MKIEVGKEYRRRDGKKAKCVHEFKEGYFAIITEPDEHYIVFSSGAYINTLESKCDLIAPWEEPKPRLKAWMINGLYGFTVVFGPTAPREGATRAPWLDEKESADEMA